MIKLVGLGNYLTEELTKMANEKESIVKKIILTCAACPEQYECYDEYENSVGYIRLRWGWFRVDCPDCRSFGDGSHTVIETNDVQGDGVFDSDEERYIYLSNAIDAIDNFYGEGYLKSIRLVQEEDDEHDAVYAKADPENYSDQEMMETLYKYQQSNFLPEELLSIRAKGPSIGYIEAVKRVLREHRVSRHHMFPEVDSKNGFSDDHVEHELEFFKTTVDGLGGMIKTINWLFCKEFDDFEEIFREYAKKGNRSL